MKVENNIERYPETSNRQRPQERAIQHTMGPGDYLHPHEHLRYRLYSGRASDSKAEMLVTLCEENGHKNCDLLYLRCLALLGNTSNTATTYSRHSQTPTDPVHNPTAFIVPTVFLALEHTSAHRTRRWRAYLQGGCRRSSRSSTLTVLSVGTT